MSTPLVSVLMPVYNGQRYLLETVNSILGQDLTCFEFIIIDDGSTDRTLQILQEVAAKDKRIRILSRANKGLVRSLNEGLAVCRGQYIARIDSDDIAKPSRLSKQVTYLENNDCICLGSWFDLIDQKGRFLTVTKPPLEDEKIQQLALAGHGSICHPASMMTRKALEQVGGYDEYFIITEDLDLWLRLGEIGRLANIPESLTQYRLHEGSISEQRCGQEREYAYEACRRAWERRRIDGVFEAGHMWRPGKDRASRHAFALKYGWWAWNSSQRRTALSYAVKAISNKPLSQDSWRLLVCSAIKPFKKEI